MFKEHTDEELKNIAIDLYHGKIFTDRDITEESNMSLGQVFLPIALGAFSECTEEDLKQIGLIYEYFSEAGPRSCNGLPGFFSFKLLSRTQFETAMEYLTEYHKLQKGFINA